MPLRLMDLLQLRRSMRKCNHPACEWLLRCHNQAFTLWTNYLHHAAQHYGSNEECLPCKGRACLLQCQCASSSWYSGKHEGFC